MHRHQYHRGAHGEAGRLRGDFFPVTVMLAHEAGVERHLLAHPGRRNIPMNSMDRALALGGAARELKLANFTRGLQKPEGQKPSSFLAGASCPSV